LAKAAAASTAGAGTGGSEAAALAKAAAAIGGSKQELDTLAALGKTVDDSTEEGLSDSSLQGLVDNLVALGKPKTKPATGGLSALGKLGALAGSKKKGEAGMGSLGLGAKIPVPTDLRRRRRWQKYTAVEGLLKVPKSCLKCVDA